MTLNESIHYHKNKLYVDSVSVTEIVQSVGTPVYIYSLRRALNNLERIKTAFTALDTHIHYSAKANANLTILRTLIEDGVGVDAVSGGEIFRALKAGVAPQNIVFAGVGKSESEIQFALEKGVGWFNVENVRELDFINYYAEDMGLSGIKIALRLNPDVTANTHPYIATGHGGAKFGLTATVIANVLKQQSQWINLDFRGLHIHIGSQLGDTLATQQAIQKALDLLAPYPNMKTLNIGGGMPAQYDSQAQLPSFEMFAHDIMPMLRDYTVLLEPGRSIIADAGILVGQVLYTKNQAAQHIAITDASMTELIRPALYQAKHEIVPVAENHSKTQVTQVVGPVCETADVLGRDIPLATLNEGDLVVALTAGAYGAVMSSNYNARPKPAEVVVAANGESWHVARRRETWEDLVAKEI
ncbi:MAG: diaminopimelate decarboxylase [Anaerolineae bacterium]|nr:diaminopimelate decarboxylase [Anaerolineae bacterium]